MPVGNEEGSGNGRLNFAPSAVVVANALREDMLVPLRPAGSLVGSEDELLERYGVSRPTLRQAVRILEGEGLLTVRRGANGGYFTRIPSHEAVSHAASVYLRSRQVDYHEILEAASILRPVLAAQAARNPSLETRRKVVEYVEEYQARPRDEEERWIVEAILGFSESIAGLVPNHLLRLFSSVTREVSALPVPIRPFAAPGRIDSVRDFHLRIALAIAAGDPDAAFSLSTELYRKAGQWTAEALVRGTRATRIRRRKRVAP
jgi:GntR family transcriptional repressor for pyruvate dehydrogenase complex